MKYLTSLISRTAVVLVYSAAAIAPAIATPNSGLTAQTVVSGHYGPIDVKTEDNKVGHWGMILKTKDNTDVETGAITVAGGGYTGWHSHPAAVFVTVVQGSIRWLNGADPACPGHIYSVGQSFIEDAFVIHNAMNASATAQAKFIVIHINPTGVPFRIDEAKPTNCSQ